MCTSLFRALLLGRTNVQNFTESNSLAFVSQSEATQLLDVAKSLHADVLGQLEVNYGQTLAVDKLGKFLFDLTSLLVQFSEHALNP